MFKVERIVLKGFAGLGLHDIKEFDFSIRKKMMIILGGNGCGKSSFLDVYFPLALAKTDFRVGGSYVNFSEKDGIRYKFSMKRTEANLLCSIRNLTTNEDVCRDVNPKVYNQRVEDITKLNKDIVDLINGRTKICSANATVRKAWFTMLSTTDLTYGLKFYKDMRTHHRDLGAVVEHLSRKIAEIKLRTVECQDERDAVKQRLDDMEVELAQYNGESIRNLEAYRDRMGVPLTHYINADKQMATATVNAVLRMPRSVDLSEGALFELTTQVAELATDVARIEGEIGQRNQQLAEYENALQRQAYLMRNHEGLKAQLEEWTQALQELTARRDGLRYSHLAELPQDQLSRAIESFALVRQKLVMAVHRNRGKYRITGAEERLEQINLSIARLDVQAANNRMRIQEIEHDLSHFEQTEAVDCPQCHHTFKPGVARGRDELLASYAEHEKQLAAATTELQQLGEEREPLLSDLTALRELRQLMVSNSNHPAFGPFFKTLYTDDVFTDNKASLQKYVAEFEAEMETARSYVSAVERHAKLTREWEDAVRSVGELDAGLLSKVDEVRKALAAVTLRYTDAKAYLESVQSELDLAKRCQKHVDDFERVQAQVRQATESTFVEAFWDVLMRNKERLLDTYSSCRTRWNAMESELRQLAEFEREHAELTEQRYHVGQMIQAWSPEKGVLQKYYFNAISRITLMMSAHVKPCWSYDMRVLPCSTDNGDLNYLFPYLLKDKVEPVSDISKASTGQAEIFNLAFRLVGYAALGLEQYPLLLDEPATGFDENHRGRLVNYVKKLLDNSMFSQLLVVSHLSDVHTKLNEAEYCVIEPDGVTLPERYNEAIRIVYES